MSVACYRVIFALAVSAVTLALAGCGAGSSPTAEVTLTVPPAKDPAKPSVGTPNTGPSYYRDEQHAPFEKAIRSLDDPPADSNRPPDTTRGGKATFALFQQVRQEWDGIKFATAAGKKVTWRATLETDRGVVELAFYPEHAPNHVRNFLALAKVGYFDGLCFERIHVEEVMAGGPKLENLEFGCPEGTGEPGGGSIGYWLLREFNKLPHEEGTLGAIRGNDADTAACRCYITLGKAPYLDGKFTVFGKVTQGLDVARIIFQQPVLDDDASRPGSRRPVTPVTITKVSLHSQED
jgi:peptidyl-prolyl cis-trans isomerase B (cyclophilin B)